ncbi:MAG TPA: tetratricopeptide repeat protein, partial [Thermoanaerobaculia bacterium]
EFFAEARSRLAPGGGIHCQWFHSYNMSTEDVKTVIATFRAEFPHATLWTLNQYDLFLLGSDSPITIDEPQFEKNFERVARDLAEIKIQDTYSIRSSMLLGDAELDRFAAGAVLNTDDSPVLEFRAPRAIHENTTEANIAALSAAQRASSPETATAENHRHKAEMLVAAENFGGAAKEFQMAMESGDSEAWKGLAAIYSSEGDTKRAIELLDGVLRRDERNVEALEKMADVLANAGSPRLSEVTDRLLTIAPDNPTGLYHLGTIRFSAGRFDEAIQIAKRVLERDPKNTRTRSLLAVAYDKTFQPDLADAEFRRTIEQAPDDYVSYNNYGIFLLNRNRPDEARDQFRRAIKLNPTNVQGFAGLEEVANRRGRPGVR